MICSTTAYHSNQDFSLKSALEWYALPQHIILKGIIHLKDIQNKMLYHSISFKSGFFLLECLRMICSTTAYHSKGIIHLKVIQNNMLYHSISFKLGFFSQKCFRMICSTTAYLSNQDFSHKSALEWYVPPQHIILKGIIHLKVIKNDMLYHSISF